MNIAIILAGGIGTRVGLSIPKQFVKIANKPVLAYTLEIFETNPNIDAIEIVCHKNWIDEVENICCKYNITKKKWICLGGESFQESTLNGILHLEGKINDDDIVVISFGVSPLTPQGDIDDSINVCKINGNGISATDIDLCTCIKDNEKYTTNNIIRETLKGFANPWSFNYGELKESYKTAINSGILYQIEPHTTSLYLALGKKLFFSKSSTRLCKITTKEDLDLFEGYIMLEDKRRRLKDDNL